METLGIWNISDLSNSAFILFLYNGPHQLLTKEIKS